MTITGKNKPAIMEKSKRRSSLVVKTPNKDNSKVVTGTSKSLKRKSTMKGDSSFKKKKMSDVPEKPVWPEFKAKAKLVREERKKRMPHSEVIAKSKHLWEQLRCKKTTSVEKKKILQKLFNVLDKDLVTLIHTHDMSRVVQSLIKNGNLEIRINVLNLLLDDVINIFKSKYASHVISCILNHSNDEIRHKLISRLSGNIVKLLSNKFSATLVDKMYNTYATRFEKVYMQQELYGDLYKGVNRDGIISLSAAFSETPNLKDSILNSTKIILEKLMAKQPALESCLLHTVLFDYLNVCKEEDRKDFFQSIIPSVNTFTSSKNGYKIILLVAQYSSAQVRRQIMKNLSKDWLKIAKDPNGYMLILGLIDLVDDTIRINKVLLKELILNIEDIVDNENGRKIILYLVAHRDTNYFHPSEIEDLKKYDNYTKKSCEQRMNELLKFILPSLLAKIQENPEKWLSNGRKGLVTSAILKAATGENVSKAFDAISDVIVGNNISITEGDNTWKLIEHPGLHMVFKKLIANDKILSSNDEVSETFSHCLVNKINTSVITQWLRINRGCFLLVCILETGIPAAIEKLRKLLTKSQVKKVLESETSKGAEILKKHL